jgi:hypothetical protein
MKTTTRSIIYLPMAAMILTAALAIPAAAQQQVPYKGAFQGKDAVNPQTIATSGTGIGTHMGAFSLTQETSLTNNTNSAHWVAANGDSIDSTFVASPDFSTHSLVTLRSRRFTPLRAARVDSPEPRVTLSWSEPTS